ncbi:MAG: SBBP repeat-containing protein [Sphingobacteriales bacterium JAD_PAG50586_3]|nr:MAG: SBBP repeat-containing protein [Sphingobacteriales bacterium JAD_PAG50586_3]
MTSVTEVAEDASHNIYVTGTISNGVSGSSGVDYHTIKVNYSNLQVAWKKSYSSSGNMEDRANGITVDGSGNVYVTGFTSSATNSHDITTVKYNLDGTQQWVKTYNNEHNGSDEGSAIDADNNGNIYVTGNSHNGSNSDYITMRYSSAGDSDWIIFYNGPNNGNDRAFDITVNNAGVFVSGQTDSLGITKFTTVKYGQLDHPFALEYLNDSVPLNINDELIVKFHDGVIPHDVIDNKSRRAGYIEDFLDDDVIEAMSDKIGTALKHLPVYKIFERMTSDDTLSITRLGDTIRLEDYYNTILIALPNNIDELAAVDSLNGLDSLIEYSALNGVCMLASTPNDAFYVGTDQPSLNSSVFGINIEPAWDIEDGKSNVKVGVNDEAVLWAHEDFGDGTFAGSKIVGGWNFKLNQHISNTTSPGGSHGTSCNGIIGALRNNSIGIAGIAGGNGTTSSGCQLFSMAITIQNFFVPVSVSASAIIEGSAYTPDGSYGYGLHVENNSWGGGLGGSTGLNHNERVLLRRAVRTCWKNGCVFVAARGNDGVDELFFPASYDHNFVLCVSANGLDGDWKDGSDPSDGLSDFTSNFGDDVDVTALEQESR